MTEYPTHTVKENNTGGYRLPAGHDDLPDRLPRSGKKQNLRVLCAVVHIFLFL